MRISAVPCEAKVQDEEHVSKAHDAVIVAIGICAVLIFNVCYVGYVTPPGGASPPWADCYYPVYVAFLYFNGFALVFSTAAIVAILVGPLYADCLQTAKLAQAGHPAWTCACGD